MVANTCIVCGAEIPEDRRVCPNCEKLKEELPTEMEALLWRPFPLVKPRITFKEYLVTSEDGSVYISLWDGSDWLSTEDPNRADTIIAWTNVPSPYKPRGGRTR